MSDSEPRLDLATRAWLRLALGPQRGEPPLARLSRPVSRSRLALIATGGFVPPGAKPFDTGRRGDPTFRELPADLDPGELRIHHGHYDHSAVRSDINVLYPLPRLRELVREGRLGALASTHYSFMGYVPITRALERIHAPRLAVRLGEESVDLALLVPA